VVALNCEQSGGDLSLGRLFYENTLRNQLLSKVYQKRKNKWIELPYGGVTAVSPDEVVQALKELGVSVSRKTIYNWEKSNLIPEPIFRNSRVTDYPDETPAEAYASITLKRYGLKQDSIARCRKRALKMEENQGNAFADWVFGADPEVFQETGFGQTWLGEKHKILHDGQHENCPVCQNLKIK
jgi:hypothetical protein